MTVRRKAMKPKAFMFLSNQVDLSGVNKKFGNRSLKDIGDK